MAASHKGKGKQEDCNCPHCGNALESNAAAPRCGGTGHAHLAKDSASSRRLTGALQSFFEWSFRLSLVRCHQVLASVTFESLSSSSIKQFLLKDGQTPADLRVWLDDEVNLKLFKRHAKEGLKTARKDLADMVLATTLDGVYERLTDLVEGQPNGDGAPPGPIACSCSLFEHIDTIEDLIDGLQEQYDECVAAPPKLTVNVGPIKNWILDERAKGHVPGAPSDVDLVELPGWAGWSKRAIPATLKRMERAFTDALLEDGIGNPYHSPHAQEYCDGLQDVDGLRLYTLSALRYELSLASKAVPLDKGKGKTKTIENGANETRSPADVLKTKELEASVALRLSAKGASSEALWHQIGSTVGGLVGTTGLPPPPPPPLAHNEPKKLMAPADKGKGRAVTPGDSHAARQAAITAYNAKDFHSALEHCNLAVDYEPHESTNFVFRARILLQLERFKEAEDDCTRALQGNEEDYKACFRRALARKAQGKHTEAQRDFEAALKMQPESAEAKAELLRLKASLARFSSQQLEK